MTNRTTRSRLASTCALGWLVTAGVTATVTVAGQDTPREILVTVRRFAFEPSRVEVTVGQRVRLLVVSADGVHGLEIKKLDVNREIPRGTTPVAIDFTASDAGEFPILCSEYCGDGHNDMTGLLVVRANDDERP